MKQSALNIITVLMCAISLAISIVTLCISEPRAEMSFDYLGFLVGILSLLVTVLIGWNIYCLVDIRRMKSEIQAIRIDYLSAINQNKADVCHIAGDIFYRNLVGDKPYSDSYYLIYYRISEVLYYSRIGEFGMCSAVIKSIIEIYGRWHDVKFSKAQKQNLWQILAAVLNQEKIPNYPQLVELVGSFSS